MFGRFLTVGLVALLLISGCSKPALPGFEEPVPVSVPASGESLRGRLSQANGVTTLSWLERDASGTRQRSAHYFDRKWRDVEDVVDSTTTQHDFEPTDFLDETSCPTDDATAYPLPIDTHRGCPAIDALGDLVVVSWFTPAADRPSIRTAWSVDSGRSFSDFVELAHRGALGRVGTAIIDDESYVVTWMESDGNESFDIHMRAITFDGQVGSTWTLGKTNVLQTLPQIVRAGDELLLVWTDEIGGITQVVGVRMKIVGFYD